MQFGYHNPCSTFSVNGCLSTHLGELCPRCYILTFLGLCSLSFVAIEGGIAYLILIWEGQYPNAYLHACFKHVS